jgi:hypothetical protein
LGTLRYDARMNGSIYQIKTGTEGLLHGGNSVKLGIVGTHNCAIVANELFTRIAEISQRLIVKETLFLKDRIHLIGARVWVASTKHSTKGALRHRLSERHSGISSVGLRWLLVSWWCHNRCSLRLLLLSRWGITYLDTLLALCFLISLS